MDLENAASINAIGMILHNKIVNENGYPLEFRDHTFLIDPYLDETPEQVVMKASQIGHSTLEIIRAIHLCKYLQANVIYTLPSRNAVKDFVMPKVDPLLEKNPVLKSMVGSTDSTALKKIGDRFLYFRGSWEQSAAISISAHILINDELDRSNQKVIRTYRTRLDGGRRERPDLGWEWQLSNPSIPGAGVDEKWQKSDQKHWYIRCPHCMAQQFLNFPENIDFKRRIYICQKCHMWLSDDVRRDGEWIAHRQSSISGYWISQLMVPWIPASKIIDDYDDGKGDQSIFYNFTLGLPYISKESGVDRQTILNCIIPGDNPRTDVAMGVDNGVVKHYVIGNRYGIFRIGTTKDWEEIEDLRNQYSASMVIDANPYPVQPKRLATKYRGKVFLHYYVQDIKSIGTTRWGNKEKQYIVESDRAKIIDQTVADLASGDMVFNLTATDLEEYITHWEVMYRAIITNARGIQVPTWKTIGEEAGAKKPDHYAHATVLFKVALEKAGSRGGIIRPEPAQRESEHPVISDEQTTAALDIRQVIERAKKTRRSWKNR